MQNPNARDVYVRDLKLGMFSGRSDKEVSYFALVVGICRKLGELEDPIRIETAIIKLRESGKIIRTSRKTWRTPHQCDGPEIDYYSIAA